MHSRGSQRQPWPAAEGPHRSWQAQGLHLPLPNGLHQWLPPVPPVLLGDQGSRWLGLPPSPQSRGPLRSLAGYLREDREGFTPGCHTDRSKGLGPGRSPRGPTSIPVPVVPSSWLAITRAQVCPHRVNSRATSPQCPHARALRREPHVGAPPGPTPQRPGLHYGQERDGRCPRFRRSPTDQRWGRDADGEMRA